MNTFLVGNGIFAEDFTCHNTDEELLKYLGITNHSILTDRIYEKDLGVFQKAIHSVLEGKDPKASVRVRFHVATGEKRNCRVRILKMEKSLFLIEIVDIENACDSCYQIISQQKKNQWLLAEQGMILFDYKFTSHEIEIYKYSDNGKLILTSTSVFSKLSKMIAEDIADLDVQFSYHSNFTVEDRNFQIVGNVQFQQNEKIALYGFVREDVEDSTLVSWGDTHDAMTGLYNKPFALTEAKKLVDKGSSVNLSFVMIDVDDFKTINDTFGHLFGDKVIQTIARILHETADGRGFASRFGGDEFFLCLTDIQTEDELRGVMQSIAFKYRNAFPDKDHKFTLSIGIAEYPRNSRSYDILMKKADRALYIAKFKGKSRYIIYKEELHGEINENAQEMVKHETADRDAQHMEVRKFLSSFTALADCTDTAQIRSAIDSMFVEIMLRYNCDAVSVYAGPEWKPIWRKGHYTAIPDNAAYMNNTAIWPDFVNLGSKHTNTTHIMGNYVEGFHDKLKDCGIVCTRQVVIGDIREHMAMFSYDSFRDIGGWPNEEKNDMIFYSHILYSLIKRVTPQL